MMSGYLSNGKFDLARDVFEKMPERDLVSWNVMLSGYVRNRKLSAARALFDQMPKGMLFRGTLCCLGMPRMGMPMRQGKFLI